jgi:hypothetical protein
MLGQVEAARGNAVIFFPICDVPNELRIALKSEIANRVPKVYRPTMFMLHERGESRRALRKKLPAYFRRQPPRDSFSAMFGCHRQAIDVPSPSVPSSDH